MTASPRQLTDVWAVVLNFNGTSDTHRCLHSLVPSADHHGVNVVVVDNHSADDPLPALHQAFPSYTYVRNAANLGFAGGNNVGIEHALQQGARWILVLNNDTVVHKDLVPRLVEVALAHHVSILGPRVGYLDEPNVTMPTAFLINRRHSRRVFDPLPEARDLVRDADTVMGCCMLVSASVFREVGAFDERFFLMHEESDLCLRARQRGLRVAFLDELLVWHKGSATFRREGPELLRYYDVRNMLWLLRQSRRTSVAHNGLLASLGTYGRYLHMARLVRSERGDAAAVAAVEDGLVDAVLGRSGPRPSSLTWARPIARAAIEAGWSLMWRADLRHQSADDRP